MRDGDILIIRGQEVDELLAGREADIMRLVAGAYLEHGAGRSSLPHSTFLRFPDDERSRIIALPAYLGGDFGVAGVKWVSSFPENLGRGLERASAVVVLNSPRTGRPEAFLEGSLISAKRTAASAALAARLLSRGQDVSNAGLVGTGPINFEVARFLLVACPEVSRLLVYDIDPERAARFRKRCRELSDRIEVGVAADLPQLLGEASLVSLATNAVKPHISDLSMCRPGSTILHVSLRDLTPEVILGCDNVVDDADHVCRAQTSVHLAEQLTGSREFIRCGIADILRGDAGPRRDDAGVTVFSPFGLGVLDLAVADFVRAEAAKSRRGLTVNSFLPTSA
ncbi:MAG TPA: 2,3-diaminopropionate biosynthesis protein SbnB [Pyrinomonadaceae bacterium]|jgi:ornithine cyclodeaminase|nr:2,3-diaminopropionate biosynthesis protein SbnB [Pyrinomonadaceae bacterium]